MKKEIIDLLIDLYNNEEMPKKIKHKETIYLFDKDIKWYISDDSYYILESNYKHINDEIEIIDEKENKENQIFENLIELRKSLENELNDIKYTWKIDLRSEEMPIIYYRYEAQIELIDSIIKSLNKENK